MDGRLAKLAFAFSVTALVVAVLGTTALGERSREWPCRLPRTPR